MTALEVNTHGCCGKGFPVDTPRNFPLTLVTNSIALIVFVNDKKFPSRTLWHDWTGSKGQETIYEEKKSFCVNHIDIGV